MAHIVIRNLWQEYGDQVILERLNFEVSGPEFVTIVGASGCGKSTFLRILLGQETPTRGEILVDGKPLVDEPGPDRGIVFQRYSVFPHLTVLENVMLGLEIEASPMLGRTFGSTRRRIRDEAAEMLDAVGLAASRNKFPDALSGGMQQRLAIAQSLVKKPKILLLDEPFGALDPGITADMHQLISRLWQQTQMTVFMITHDIKEGFELGTRLLAFDKVRLDPQAPNAFGATITYDIPLNRSDMDVAEEIADAAAETESFSRAEVA